MKFKVSFYVCAYNVQRTISRCLNSIINQSIKPFEIIVVDDGSIDDTSKILLNFKTNVKIIKMHTPIILVGISGGFTLRPSKRGS